MRGSLVLGSSLSSKPAGRALLDSLRRRAAHAVFARIRRGSLTVVDGTNRVTYGEPDGVSATAVVHDGAAYGAILVGGSVGAGESYMRGEWTCDDLPSLARLFVRNLDALGALDGGSASFRQIARDLVTKVTRRNTRGGSRRNIARHYDLPKELFESFLDPSLTYSSAIFESPTTALEEAQRAKNDRICKKLALTPRDHLLEIGTGWGALALHAASTYGCRVTTTTVSAEQHKVASERVHALGLSGLVEVLLSDYRDLRGTFDKLVSVEMVEAVGHEYLDTFLRVASDRLAKDGLLLLQAITICDRYYAEHKEHVDFIKEHIFPGSSIPSVTSLIDAAARTKDLTLFHFEDITSHYARTLRAWRERLLANASAVRRLGYSEELLRMWEVYLAYCEAGFEERYLGSVQMLFAKPDCRHAPILPRL
jgi:cyclopropane-fatty-acyl-phospholipid synthase